MAQPDNLAFISLKRFLYLWAGVFALAAILLLFWGASAASVTGRTPASALSLVEGANTGVLGPGEQRWFKFRPDGQGQAIEFEKFLTLVFTPSDGNRIWRVSLQLFEENQLHLFNESDAGQMNNIGAGQVVSRDDSAVTGELFWTGWLWGQETYYVQLLNGNDIAIDYWLFTDNVSEYALGEPAPVAPDPAPVVNSTAGQTPAAALPLQPEVSSGWLAPGQEAWYSFSVADFDQDLFEPMALTLIATPDDGQRIHYLTFDVFTAGAVQNWSAANQTGLSNMGGGAVVTRDNNPLTGERFWSGWIVDSDLYYVRLRNGTGVDMGYWLFNGDVYGPELN